MVSGRWEGLQAPAPLRRQAVFRYLLFAVIAYRIQVDRYGDLLGAATATVFAIILEEFARNNWRRYNETYSFVEELGSRTYEYVSVAVQYPQEFELYRARRTVAQSAHLEGEP